MGYFEVVPVRPADRYREDIERLRQERSIQENAVDGVLVILLAAFAFVAELVRLVLYDNDEVRVFSVLDDEVGVSLMLASFGSVSEKFVYGRVSRGLPIYRNVRLMLLEVIADNIICYGLIFAPPVCEILLILSISL